MKRKSSFYLKIIICCSAFFRVYNGELYAQNPLIKQWDYRYGGTAADWFVAFEKTSDNGYILGGYSDSQSSGDKSQNGWNSSTDYWIIKVDSVGNVQWDKTYGGTDADYLSTLIQTNDGGYILGGNSYSNIGGDKTENNRGASNTFDYWFLKLDANGNKQWDKTFGGNGDDISTCVKQTFDGGYIVGGRSGSGISGEKTQALQGGIGDVDYWIVKIDSLGNLQWDRDLGGFGPDWLYSMVVTNSGNFLLGGSSSSNIGGDKTQNTWGGIDFWLIEIDALGHVIWDKDFGGSSSDDLSKIEKTSDNGYILGGLSSSPVSGNKTQQCWGFNDFWIVKIDSVGNLAWDKDYGGSDMEEQLGNIMQTTDGGFLLSGSSFSNVSGNKTENNLAPVQSWIVKTDTAGTMEWDKTIFINGKVASGIALETNANCYTVANTNNGIIDGYKTQLSWSGSRDYWIVKFCDSTLTSIPHQNQDLNVEVLPNPFSDNLIITLAENQQCNAVLKDVFGRHVVSQKISSRKAELITYNLTKGIYFLEITSENKLHVEKVIKN